MPARAPRSRTPKRRPAPSSGPSCRLLSLGADAHGIQRRRPELLEVGAQLDEALGCRLVDPPGALAALRDQARLLQDAQVLRDGGAADRQPLRDLADRPGPSAEPFVHGPPRRVT